MKDQSEKIKDLTKALRDITKLRLSPETGYNHTSSIIYYDYEKGYHEAVSIATKQLNKRYKKK